MLICCYKRSGLTLKTSDTWSRCAVKATGTGAAGAGVSSTPSRSIHVGSHDHAHSDQLSLRVGSAVLDDVGSRLTEFG